MNELFLARLLPIISWVELCSSFVSRLLCVGYIPSSLISASSILIVELSGSMARSSAFAIVVRERHAFFSHHSILFSLDFFISNFLSIPAWSVSVDAAIVAKACDVLSALLVRIGLS